jgi:hypothetical protein
MSEFWRDATRDEIEPRRKHRFQVKFFNSAGSELQSFYAKTMSKPTLTLNVVEHKYLGHTYKFPGNATWTDCEAKFVDVDKTAISFLKRIRDGGYSPLTNEQDTTTVSKKKAVEALGTVEIQSLGPSAENATGAAAFSGQAKIEDKWILHNVWISKISFGELDYSDDGLLDVSVTFTYDWAEYQNDDQVPSEIFK